MQILHKVAVIAKFLNLTQRRVQQLAKDGIIPKADKGKYDLVGCVQGYIKYLQDRAYGGSDTPADTHLERARLLKAQADLAEIELAEKSGKVVLVERVETDWTQMMVACRAKLLSIPRKAAYQISHLEETHEIEKILKGSIYEALAELAAYEINDEDISADDSDGDEYTNSATRINSEPVGG